MGWKKKGRRQRLNVSSYGDAYTQMNDKSWSKVVWSEENMQLLNNFWFSRLHVKSAHILGSHAIYLQYPEFVARAWWSIYHHHIRSLHLINYPKKSKTWKESPIHLHEEERKPFTSQHIAHQPNWVWIPRYRILASRIVACVPLFDCWSFRVFDASSDRCIRLKLSDERCTNHVWRKGDHSDSVG